MNSFTPLEAIAVRYRGLHEIFVFGFFGYFVKKKSFRPLFVSDLKVTKSIRKKLPNQTMICGNILLCKTAIYYFEPASSLVMICKSVFMSCRQSERVNVCTFYCKMKTA